MELPYSVEVYFASMAAYNAAWFPAPLVALLLALVTAALCVRSPSSREAAASRLVGAILGAAWVWVGVAHQLQHMATLDFLAPVYGIAWIVQGGLIALTCTVVGRVRFRVGRDLAGWTGMVLALFGLLGYPLVMLLLGHGWQAVPLVGTAPDPTAIFTVGLLLMARPRPPLFLFVLPVAWAGVAGASGYLLRFPLDYAVGAAVLIALAFALRARWRPHVLSR